MTTISSIDHIFIKVKSFFLVFTKFFKKQKTLKPQYLYAYQAIMMLKKPLMD
jgi:hypothetical protein